MPDQDEDQNDTSGLTALTDPASVKFKLVSPGPTGGGLSNEEARAYLAQAVTPRTMADQEVSNA